MQKAGSHDAVHFIVTPPHAFNIIHDFAISTLLVSVFAAEPSFRVPEINVTAVKGETAILPCSIQFLGEHKVGEPLFYIIMLTLMYFKQLYTKTRALPGVYIILSYCCFKA